MGDFDKEIAWKAIPVALEATLRQLKGKRELNPYEKSNLGIEKLSAFKPLGGNGSRKSTKKKFFYYIEQMLQDGITPAKGYIPEVYAIENFPFAFGQLTMENGRYLTGPGMVSILNGGGWHQYMDKALFDSIPESTLQTLLDEFKLDCKFDDRESNRYYFHQLPVENPKVWYLVDAYKEHKLFARNFAVAYTNIFLGFLENLDFPENFSAAYENQFIRKVE